MIVFTAFTLLVGLTGWFHWSDLQQKSLTDWFLDSAGLWVQGLIVPLLQLTLLQTLYLQLFPVWHRSLAISPALAFGLSFIAVDYLYYWNHRLLHSRVWCLHHVHHTVTTMDVLGTSRNTLWSSFLLVYLWVHGLWIYLLADPTIYILGVSLTAALDLWRHSRFGPTGRVYRWLEGWLILPQDHSWHHQRPAGDRADHLVCNYGANLKLWDRLHGTLYQSSQWPPTLGQTSRLSLWRQLVYPWGNTFATLMSCHRYSLMPSIESNERLLLIIICVIPFAALLYCGLVFTTVLTVPAAKAHPLAFGGIFALIPLVTGAAIWVGPRRNSGHDSAQ